MRLANRAEDLQETALQQQVGGPTAMPYDCAVIGHLRDDPFMGQDRRAVGQATKYQRLITGTFDELSYPVEGDILEYVAKTGCITGFVMQECPRTLAEFVDH